MVNSDFNTVHRLMSADASLLQQLCVLQIFVYAVRVAMQKTSMGQCKTLEVWTQHN